MGFSYKNISITLENYKSIFKECSPDILDEIRSAIIDDTQISKFIKPCGHDSYKLGQLRMASREFIPTEFLNPLLTGDTIYAIRQGFANGISMDALLRYIKPRSITVDSSILEQLAQAILLGADIDRIDFTGVLEDNITILLKGLIKGYPMWLLLDDINHLSERQITALMRGMALGLDVHPFVNGKWTDRQLILLFSYAKSIDINDLLQYINYNFSFEILKELLPAAEEKVPITKLCIKDEDGRPIYNQYQISVLIRAIKENCKNNDIFNPSLSDLDMEDILNAEMSYKTRKKVKIKLSSLDV